jgi:hypothetical protein
MCTRSNRVTRCIYTDIHYNTTYTSPAKSVNTHIHIPYIILYKCVFGHIFQGTYSDTGVYNVFWLLYMLTMISDTDIRQSMYRPGTQCIARSRNVKRFVHNRVNTGIRPCFRCISNFKHSTLVYSLSSGYV